MKFFKHYKNKPYKYIGVAKHSETLEDVVIYETLYENKLAKVWVRPKDMFFESIVVEGKQTPRFRKIPLELSETTSINEKDIEFIAAIMEKSFGQWDSRWFFTTFNNRKNFYLIKASVEGTPVGFKLGYALSDTEFYSWLGGVVPEFRGLGIAADLMQAQHEWCRKNGYTKVQTKTQNRFRDMLILNLRFGFDIVGLHMSDEGGPKIVLEKQLQ